MSTAAMTLAAREREDFAALLRDLDDDQWAASSLCPGWSVRDVAVHVVSYDALSWTGLAASFVRGRMSVDRINEKVLRSHDDLSNDEVVDLVARHLTPRGLTAGFGGRIALTDGLIHHQDVRRALALPRSIEEARLVTALSFAIRAPTLPAGRNARGLHLVATDVDWQHGRGDSLEGPGEALLMAVAGRRDALNDLAGPGVATLAARVS